PLTAAALAGVLRPALSDVNMVSAPAILADKGAELTESKRAESPTYDSLIRIKICVGDRWRTVAGAIVNGQPRIVEVKGMALDARFRPVMLFVNNSDAPGFIGALGMLLGDAGVNIATFNLGRDEQGGDAIALVGVDQIVPDDVLAKLNALPHVRYVKVLSF
ncbi:MAG: ACT domain-containing protein, partial [Pseudomonadota bacterium]